MIFILGQYFNLVEVPRDGGCLFAALSHGLFFDINHGLLIRSEIVDKVYHEWESYQMLTDKGGDNPYNDVEEYSRSMRKQGTYGCFAEIKAAASLFNVPIVVYQYDGEQYTVSAVANRDGKEKPIYLLFLSKEVHYQCLLPDCNSNGYIPPINVDGSHSETITSNDTMDADPLNAEFHDSSSDVESLSDTDDGLQLIGGGVPIGSSLTRPKPVSYLTNRITSRLSIALPKNRYGVYYFWAGKYRGENVRDVQPLSLGEMNVQCTQEGCTALFLEAERLTNSDTEIPFWCCNKSTHAVLTDRGVFRDIVDESVHELYFGTSEQAVHFQTNIRAYNHVLTTAVPIVKYGKIRSSRGINIVTVNGKVTFSAPVYPEVDDEGVPTTSGQLFFVEMNAETLARRCNLTYGPVLREDVVLTLESYLRRHNDFVKTFELAGLVERRLAERGEKDVGGRNVYLYVNPHRQGFRTTDRELYSIDSSAHRPDDSAVVAAVFVGQRPTYNYDIVFCPRRDESARTSFRSVDRASPMLDVMLYPLVHLHGEDSFLRANPRSNVVVDHTYMGTLRQYYSCRIMTRAGRLSGDGVLFQCRSLFQQWLCEAALKIMDQNLSFIDSQQEELTACQYDSLQRYVASVAEEDGKRPGRIVILPKSQQKSERRMYSNYMDAVRISSELGPPTWFFTLTTNPSWPEITSILEQRGLPDRHYMHAPDAVVRSYLARCNVFLSDIVNKSIVGQVKGYVGVHEFTTTGLPHFHLAVITNEQDRPTTPEEIDAFLSAEIPGEDEPELRKLVLGMMMHKPCDGSLGKDHANPPCRPDGGDCRHGFPKDFRDVTEFTGRGPLLRRRQTPAIWHERFHCYVDNRWTVEYVIKLVPRMVCHLNGLACGRNMFWKYLFGYMEKASTGHHVQGSMMTYARNTAENRDVLDWDEVDQCRSMRMIGPFEAVFSILGQPMTLMSHSVVSMPVHLPDKQILYYKGDPTTAALLTANSKLLGWFRLNAEDEEACALFYADVVQHYRWERGNWVRKSRRGTTLGRLMHVNPSPRNLELFHLRLLLLNRKGVKSWAELLTVNGVHYETFREACDALGIAAGSATYDYSESLRDVVNHGSPWQIRHFFAVLISLCFLRNTCDLWHEHRDKMSEDFRRKGGSYVASLVRARDEIIDHCLAILEDGSTRESLRRLLPVPEDSQESDNIQHDFADDTQRALPEPHDSVNLTHEQQAIFDRVMAAVDRNDNSPKVFCLTAPAGCGKTFLYNALVKEVERKKKKCVSTAFTGIAAALLPAGETCHSAFGIPIRMRLSANERSIIERLSPQGNSLESASLILIDEASMLSKIHANIIDNLLRMITGKMDVLCGGKVVVFGGDMGQVLPVIDGVPPTSVDQFTLPAWEHWPSLQPLVLTVNMRAEGDHDFARWLMSVRDGSANLHGTDTIYIPRDLVVSAHGEAGEQAKNLMESVVEKVFGDFSEVNRKTGVILTPTNDVVRSVNRHALSQMPGAERCYVSKTSLVFEDGNADAAGFQIVQEELDNVQPARLPPHRLVLKIGAVVMLLLNMSKQQGLCNGTRFIVTGLYKDTVRLQRIVPFKGKCNEIYLPKVFMRTDDVPVAGTIQRHQLPIRLAFCMTINKGQGQGFKRVGLFLQRPVFGHGQFFVGVSRARSRSGLCIAVVDGPQQGREKGRSPRVRTKNIVLKHLFN